MYLIQIDAAQNCSLMCICIEVLIQVLKRKNMHVLPVSSGDGRCKRA